MLRNPQLLLQRSFPLPSHPQGDDQSTFPGLCCSALLDVDATEGRPDSAVWAILGVASRYLDSTSARFEIPFDGDRKCEDNREIICNSIEVGS